MFSLLLLIGAAQADERTNNRQVASAHAAQDTAAVQAQCLPDHDGYLRARLSGSIDADLVWNDAQMDCTGSIRPGGSGLRLRFSARQTGADARLVLLFGVSGLKEGETAHALPVNLTVMLEGKGEFYATQGDNKCTVDEIHQEPLQGIPLKQRSWRVVASGFCTQPARALNGKGIVLVTRFDFAGHAEFSSEDDDDQPVSAATPPRSSP